MKRGRAAEMPGEGRDFSPRSDQEDALFLQKKC